MCNRIKSAKQIRCAKTVYWDLINSNMNRRDVQEGCVNGFYRVCTHSSNTEDENMNVLQLIMSLVSVYETGFVLRSLMAWGKKLLLSLSVFAIMLLKRLPDGSKQKRWLPGWVESLRIWNLWIKHLVFTDSSLSLEILRPKSEFSPYIVIWTSNKSAMFVLTNWGKKHYNKSRYQWWLNVMID